MQPAAVVVAVSWCALPRLTTLDHVKLLSCMQLLLLLDNNIIVVLSQPVACFAVSASRLVYSLHVYEVLVVHDYISERYDRTV